MYKNQHVLLYIHTLYYILSTDDKSYSKSIHQYVDYERIYIMQLSYYFIWFMLYSFIGWLYESTICSIPKHHKMINRGYLLGPYCPIYGFGAVLNVILLKNVERGLVIFVLAMVTSSIVEYVTSYVMEKLFHARWWDYSHYPLNVQGRICLYGGIIFGGANVLLIKVVHPYVIKLTGAISPNVIQIVSIILLLLILLDTVFTTIHIQSLNVKFKKIEDSVTMRINTKVSSIVDKKRDMQENLKVMKYKGTTLNITNVKKQFKNSELRILHAFPKFKSTRYGVIVDKIKEILE